MHLQLHRACTNYIDELYFVVVLTNVKAQHTCTSTTVLVAVPPPPHTHTHTHSHTIWGPQTDGAKCGHCQRMVKSLTTAHWTLLEVEKVEDEVLQEEESIIIMIIYINIK